jgi:hypothetical protein
VSARRLRPVACHALAVFPTPWHADKLLGGYVVRDANGARAFFRRSSWRASAAAIWSHILLSSSKRDRCTGLLASFANCAHCSAF